MICFCFSIYTDYHVKVEVVAVPVIANVSVANI